MMNEDEYKCKTCKWFHSLSDVDFCTVCEAGRCIICTDHGRHCSEYEEGLNDGGKSYSYYNDLMEEIEDFLFEFDYYGWRPYPGENSLILELDDKRLFLVTVDFARDPKHVISQHVVGVHFQRYDPETAEIISDYDPESHRYSLRRRSEISG